MATGVFLRLVIRMKCGTVCRCIVLSGSLQLLRQRWWRCLLVLLRPTGSVLKPGLLLLLPLLLWLCSW